jgi:hypothetical protein
MGQYEACFCIVIVGDLRTDPGEIVQGEGEEGGLSTILFFTKLELMPAELTLHGTIIHLYLSKYKH